MHVNIKTTMRIDTDQLTEQQALIAHLIAMLESGRTGISIMRDKDALTGIQDILDAVADSVDDEGHDDSSDPVEADGAPDCPGCTHPGNCEDCEYQYDPDVDPVCEDYTPPRDRRN